MELVRIKIDENQNEQIIILKEKDGGRVIPIVIGMAEVNSIKMKLSGLVPPRPLTHDLILRITEELDAKLTSVLISKIEDSTFFAQIILGRNGKKVEVDARPSDSIALALRAGCPIYCTEDVLNVAGLEE
jgi:bifunctional DNase/RNase